MPNSVRALLVAGLVACLAAAACDSDSSPTYLPTDTGAADTGAADGFADDGGSDASDDTGSVTAGAFCDDDSQGSATTPTPVADGEAAFSTRLLDCSLSAAEAAACIGASAESAVDVADGTLTITGNGIPDHDVDLFPNEGNPNAVAPQNLSWELPLEPVRTATATAVRYAGVALNGIKMEPETAEVYSNGGWRYEALTFSGRLSGDTSPVPAEMSSLGFDCNFAHVQPNGEYHYHGVPTGLMPAERVRTQVGWAADGHPIFGRWGYLDPGDSTSLLVELTGSYRVKSGERSSADASGPVPPGDYDGTFVQDWEYVDGVGELDECNGREESVEIDGRVYDYAYYLTYTYPFMPRCVWGTPGTGFASGGAGGAGPTPCSAEADCVGACFDGAAGCTCVDSPRDGRVCVPTCSDAADCSPGQSCTRGICTPDGP